MHDVISTFEQLLQRVHFLWPHLPVRLVVREDAGRHGSKNCARAYAYCAPVEPARRPGARARSQVNRYVIAVAPKIVSASPARVQALLAHELAHAVLLHCGNDEHSERDADIVAESIFGFRIYYDHEDVQTTHARGNRRPRPSYLDDDGGFTRTT